MAVNSPRLITTGTGYHAVPKAGIGSPVVPGPTGPTLDPVPVGPTGPELGPPPPPPPADPINDLARQRTIDLLSRGPMSAQDVYNSPQAAAERLASQRGSEHQIAQIAERDASGGFGNLQGDTNAINQASAEGSSKFTGDLAGQMEDQRLQQILAGLNQTNVGNRLGFDLSSLQLQANRDALLQLLLQSGGGGA